LRISAGTANPFAALSDGINGLFDAEEKARQPKPAPQIDLSLVCTLEDLYNGVKKSLAVPKRKLDNEGAVVEYTKTYIIQVESQWVSGTKLRYVKEPEDVTGDVVFTVEVEKHKTFTISGFDLKMTHPTPLYNALTGTVIALDMPDGRRLNVSIEEVIDTKLIRTIKGEGMLNKATNTRGDVIIAFDIKFPRKLNQFQKDLLDMALRLPIELTEDTHIQRRLITTGLKLPNNLAQSERDKVEAVNKLMTKRDAPPVPE
jgi:DnaJ-class molecular chaperone